MGAEKPSRGVRADYACFASIATRWADNDVYGHINNVAYYGYFDTAVNQTLIEAGALDIHAGAVIGLVVETGCRYYAPMAFPDLVTVGLRVSRLGTSSVRYELGVFRNEEEAAGAEGHFVHVYVDRATRRPRPLPDPLRAALTPLLREKA